MGRIALVTGVSRYLGGRLASVLAADPAFERVIGVDSVPPPSGLPIEFVRADIRNPVIGRVMDEAGVDTCVHMGVIATPRQAGGRTAMKDINVIGTMQLLAACQRVPSLTSFVVKSSSSVYGAGPKDPAMFTEEMEPKHPPRSGWAKDCLEVETYVRGFSRRRPDVAVSILRFANFMGPALRTGMTGYFSLPVIPTVLGFDARLQFVHEDDGMRAIKRCVDARADGIFNVAGPGAVTLSQAVRWMRKPMAPVPAFMLSTLGRTIASARFADLSTEQIRYLTYGRVLDISAIERSIGFVPEYTSAEAFMAFARREGVRDEPIGL
jgi:UDP-glucose 4-epimerase